MLLLRNIKWFFSCNIINICILWAGCLIIEYSIYLRVQWMLIRDDLYNGTTNIAVTDFPKINCLKYKSMVVCLLLMLHKSIADLLFWTNWSLVYCCCYFDFIVMFSVLAGKRSKSLILYFLLFNEQNQIRHLTNPCIIVPS